MSQKDKKNISEETNVGQEILAEEISIPQSLMDTGSGAAWSELKTLREDAGLSQEALAKEIGISQSALGNYERGSRAPDKDIIIALAKRFNVSSDYLLGISKDRRRAPSTADKFGLKDTSIQFLKDLQPFESETIDKVIASQSELLRGLLLKMRHLYRLAERYNSKQQSIKKKKKLSESELEAVSLNVDKKRKEVNQYLEELGYDEKVHFSFTPGQLKTTLSSVQRQFTFLMFRCFDIPEDIDSIPDHLML